MAGIIPPKDFYVRQKRRTERRLLVLCVLMAIAGFICGKKANAAGSIGGASNPTTEETLLLSNALLESIDAQVCTSSNQVLTNSKLDAANTNLDTIETYLDGVETNQSNAIANQTNGTSKVRILDVDGTGITSTTTPNSKQALDVYLRAGYSTVTNTTAAVSRTTSTLTATSNADRRFLRVNNNTGSNLWCSEGGTAATGSGLLITNNSRYEWNINNLYTGAVNCISGASLGGPFNVEVSEGTL